MTLIIGARCKDGIILAADCRRLSRYERGPKTSKVFKLSCGVVVAGAGDDAVLNEARLFIDRQTEKLQSQSAISSLLDVVEVTAAIVNELVNCYKDKVEEPFGYVLAGLDNLGSGSAKLYTIFGAGFSDVPWVCLGSGGVYARPLVDLLLADSSLPTEEAVKIIAPLFTLVSNVQTTVGDGVDVYVVRDNQGVGDIVRQQEIELDGLRSAILNAIGVQP